MGLFWDLIQQSQISTQRERADTLEHRVERLEREVQELKRRHVELLETLERHFGQDINQNGRVGS
jgi:chaperonin cofactor prefoldin